MLLLLLAGSKWIIIIILALYHRERNRSVYLLAGGLMMMSLFDINFYLAVSGISQLLTAAVYLYSSPFVLLIGPCFYLYVRNTMADRNQLNRLDLLHTIPFWLMWINHLPYFKLSFEDQFAFAAKIHADLNQVREPSHYLLLQHYPLNMLRGAIGLGYFVACLWRIRRYVNKIPAHPEVPRRQSTITLRWIGFLTGTLTIVSIIFLFMTHDLRDKTLSAEHYQNSGFYYILLFFYGILSMCLLFFPEILYGLPRAETMIQTEQKIERETPSGKDTEARVKLLPVIEQATASLLKGKEPDPFFDLAQQILIYIELKRPYLDQAFSVTTISMHFNVPRHHVDYCFSRIIDEKFTDMRRRLRVAHAISLLHKLPELSFDGIGRSAGFASKSTFYSTFKEVTGLTPSEYIKQHGIY